MNATDSGRDLVPRGRGPDRDNPRRVPGARGVGLGRIAGIPIRAHWTFVLLIALVVLGAQDVGIAALAGSLLWIGALFGSVVLHELSHCLVARRRGAVVIDILLLPIGGLSQFASMPEAPADELAVAIAGPLSSLLLGAALVVVALATGAGVWPPSLFAGSWWARLAWLNVLLGLFNLLPALPMDGGRVLRAALARRRGRLEATRLAAGVARLIGLAMLVVGAFLDWWFLLLGLFVLLGASAEEEQARHPTKPPPADADPDGDARRG